MVGARAKSLGVRVTSVQTNHEGAIVDLIGDAKADGYAGIVLNAGAYTHTSIAILDAIRGAEIPTVEVHLSNPEAREAFRHQSVIAAGCLGKVTGFGALSYVHALEALVAHLRGKL
jgi:3-dehydroquinate dehydratase-2